MGYETPTDTFAPAMEATRRANGANTLRQQMAMLYKRQHEDFWATPRIKGEAALTMDEMQAVLDALPSAVDILTDSAAFIGWMQQAHPDLFAESQDGEAVIPARYTSSPYEYTVGAAGVTLTALKPEWAADWDTEEGETIDAT